MELFRIMFFKPRTSTLQPWIMQDAKNLIEKSLRGFLEFITVAAYNNSSGSSYPFSGMSCDFCD
jgi:hypothetical protein